MSISMAKKFVSDVMKVFGKIENRFEIANLDELSDKKLMQSLQMTALLFMYGASQKDETKKIPDSVAREIRAFANLFATIPYKDLKKKFIIPNLRQSYKDDYEAIAKISDALNEAAHNESLDRTQRTIAQFKLCAMNASIFFKNWFLFDEITRDNYYYVRDRLGFENEETATVISKHGENDKSLFQKIKDSFQIVKSSKIKKKTLATNIIKSIIFAGVFVGLMFLFNLLLPVLGVIFFVPALCSLAVSLIFSSVVRKYGEKALQNPIAMSMRLGMEEGAKDNTNDLQIKDVLPSDLDPKDKEKKKELFDFIVFTPTDKPIPTYLTKKEKTKGSVIDPEEVDQIASVVGPHANH